MGNVTVNLSTNSTLVEGKEVELLGKEFDLWFISFKIKMLSFQKHKSLIDFGDLIAIRLSRLSKFYVSKIRKKLKGTEFAKKSPNNCVAWGTF